MRIAIGGLILALAVGGSVQAQYDPLAKAGRSAPPSSSQTRVPPPPRPTPPPPVTPPAASPAAPTPATPLAPPAAGVSRFKLLGALSVDAPGFPAAYGPHWPAVGALHPASFTSDRRTGTTREDIGLGEYQGRAVLDIKYGDGRDCAGELSGLPAAVTNVPHTFVLVNFRDRESGAPGCSTGRATHVGWGGSVTLRLDTGAVLVMDVTLQALDAQGRVTETIRSENLRMEGDVTPAQAAGYARNIAEGDRKAQAAFDVLARAQAAAPGAPPPPPGAGAMVSAKAARLGTAEASNQEKLAAVAGLPLEGQCAALAASDAEPGMAGKGVGLKEIAPGAIVVCQAAATLNPTSAALHYRLGRALFAHSQYDPAVVQFQRSLELGYKVAYGELGYAFDTGRGARTDHAAARRYFEQGAAGGDAYCMGELGALLKDPVYGTPNLAAANQWLKRASDLGEANATYNLAIAYLDGDGVTKNIKEGMRLAALAEQQANAQKDPDLARDARVVMALQTYFPNGPPDNSAYNAAAAEARDQANRQFDMGLRAIQAVNQQVYGRPD